MRGRRLLGACLVSAAAVAVVPLAALLDAHAPRLSAGEPLFLPRAALLRPALLGFDRLAADLYWLRTIQYFGGRYEAEGRYPSLYPLLELTTSLDPHFLEAYQLGGLLLLIAKQAPQAIRIYEKGIAANPTRWELPYDLGRLYFLDLKDNVQALRWWEAADRLPGRPEYLPRFLARLHAKTGDLETAIELWRAMYERSDNEWVKKTAKAELERLLTQVKTPPAQARP
jgi:tetratricopeptide (TPR) repeat protein